MHMQNSENRESEAELINSLVEKSSEFPNQFYPSYVEALFFLISISFLKNMKPTLLLALCLASLSNAACWDLMSSPWGYDGKYYDTYMMFLASGSEIQSCFKESSVPSDAQYFSIVYSYGNVTTFPSSFFKSAPGLKRIGFYGTDLTDIPCDAFSENKQLEVIYLAHSRIQGFNCNLFASNTALKFISMEANRITQFPPNFFKGLSNLQQLSFQNNLVTALPQNLFAGTSLTQVDLSNNPLKQCAISRTDKALENSKVCYSATQ
jgi:hypothetical protein